MEKPPNPREGFTCDPRGAASPAPSCQSVKSDWSMDQPIVFKGGCPSQDITPACDLCIGKRRKAMKYCQTCTASYCETHVRQHYTVAALQRHTLVEADGDQASPPPGEIQFLAVRSDSVSLSWGAPEGMDSQTLSYEVTWVSGTERRCLRVKGVTHMDILFPWSE
ncbi:tripartite motif-containing protein 16-like [Megalops cyprinoides]|uniref:tripartite motif-containing protein 16-like n=1 Tax=Megalops cyprinoides TaxID=118141 RepID=UPI00186406AF|nr:tripartite motif-containing protein 16-like [Megalops cyprinoides]